MEHAPEPVANFVDKLWMFAYFVIHRRTYPQPGCISCTHVMNMQMRFQSDGGIADGLGMNMHGGYPQEKGNMRKESSTVSTELSTESVHKSCFDTSDRGQVRWIVRLFLQ